MKRVAITALFVLTLCLLVVNTGEAKVYDWNGFFSLVGNYEMWIFTPEEWTGNSSGAHAIAFIDQDYGYLFGLEFDFLGYEKTFFWIDLDTGEFWVGDYNRFTNYISWDRLQ